MRIGLHGGPFSVSFRVGGSNRPSTPEEDAFAMGTILTGLGFAFFPFVGLLVSAFGIWYLRKRKLNRFVPLVFVGFPILLTLWAWSVWSYAYSEALAKSKLTSLADFKSELPEEFYYHLVDVSIPAIFVAVGLFAFGWLVLRAKEGAKWVWGKL